ncbi:hypothetical protein EYF80_060880 [Liparis tanakae]|uniref:Uncharacterized protein n=1 Tax=Liparis tanakae TaxID=230148 RepID=A0A4Z2EKS9_9TELE|nr:hypothetical protein EYF80_060880 [Liparis tanakae]
MGSWGESGNRDFNSSTPPLLHSSTPPLLHSSTPPLLHSSTPPFLHPVQAVSCTATSCSLLVSIISSSNCIMGL